MSTSRSWPTLAEVMAEIPEHLLRHVLVAPQATPGQIAAATAELERRRAVCPWTTWAECALAREREVAGTATPPRSCEVHGDPEPELDEEPFPEDPNDLPWTHGGGS